MIKRWLTSFHPSYPRAIVYMLQDSEYKFRDYFKWMGRVKDWRQVMYRRRLTRTTKTNALLFLVWSLLASFYLAAVALKLLWLSGGPSWLVLLAIIIFGLAPWLVRYLITLPLLVGDTLITQPRLKREIAASRLIFETHPGTTIAVAGSYGKTTVKEILTTVLSEGLKVAATPENYNTAIAQARFAAKLGGDEDVLVIEYGEYRPSDVAEFAATTRPDIGIITGLNESHLDNFGTLEETGKSLMALADYLKDQRVYVSADDEDLQPFVKPTHQLFGHDGVGEWKVSGAKTGLDGTSFMLTHGSTKLKLESQLLGLHLVGPLALSAVLGHELGLSDDQIKAGVAKTKPFEHRLQPRVVAGGAIVLDDTYNGSIDGVRAGLVLASALKPQRLVYVTPGLVEQGDRTEAVHRELGRLVGARANTVYLMKNSVTDYIMAGLAAANFEGEVQVIDQPLEFYQNIDLILQRGDVALLQNDWPDSYA